MLKKVNDSILKNNGCSQAIVTDVSNEDDIKTANPKKHDKNMGIIIKAKGIKVLNISSWVKEIEIQ